MSTVLVLGAGLTRAASSASAWRKTPPLDADFFDIARRVNKDLHDSVIESLDLFGGEYSRVLSRSLETAATYLFLKALDGERRDPFHMGFLRLLTLLNQVLAETTNEISVTRRTLTYRFLLHEYNRLERTEDLRIITFNYDLLIERVLQEIAQAGRPDFFRFPGCYRFEDDEQEIRKIRNSPTFNMTDRARVGVALYKLHGSMNWQSRHRSNEPTPNELYSPTRQLYLTNSPMIGGNLRTTKNNRTLYMKPLIVPPVNGKRSVMHQSLQFVWRQAAEALREATRVVIVGYSCPPLDIEARILLSENLRSNPLRRVFIVDPSAQSASKFSDICGVDHVTIYDDLATWVADYQ